MCVVRVCCARVLCTVVVHIIFSGVGCVDMCRFMKRMIPCYLGKFCEEIMSSTLPIGMTSLNQVGLVPIYSWSARANFRPELRSQVRGSLTCSGVEKREASTSLFFKSLLTNCVSLDGSDHPANDSYDNFTLWWPILNDFWWYELRYSIIQSFDSQFQSAVLHLHACMARIYSFSQRFYSTFADC